LSPLLAWRNENKRRKAARLLGRAALIATEGYLFRGAGVGEGLVDELIELGAVDYFHEGRAF